MHAKIIFREGLGDRDKMGDRRKVVSSSLLTKTPKSQLTAEQPSTKKSTEIYLKKSFKDKEKDEWIRKLWYIYTMEYYSAIKKNSFESVLMRWMKMEPIIQSEVSQKDKEHYSILTHMYGI